MEDLDAKRWPIGSRLRTGDRDAADVLPPRTLLEERLTALWNYPRTGLPQIEGGQLFYSKNTGLQRQAPIYMRANATAAPKMVLDPNTLSPDGSLSLAQYAPSPDGKQLAYAIAEGGADWETVKIRDLTTGNDTADEVRWMRFSGLSWTKDAKGFFYSRYPEPPKNKVLEAALAGQAIYYHRVGTPQSQDELIYERKDHPGWIVNGSVTEDGKYLLIVTFEGSDNNNRLYVADLGDPKKPNVKAAIKPITEAGDAEYSPFGSQGSHHLTCAPTKTLPIVV